MTGVRSLVQDLSTDGIIGNLWINGSFVTDKLNPFDVDVVLYVSAETELTPDQQNRLNWLASK